MFTAKPACPKGAYFGFPQRSPEGMTANHSKPNLLSGSGYGSLRNSGSSDSPGPVIPVNDPPVSTHGLPLPQGRATGIDWPRPRRDTRSWKPFWVGVW
jgi:hypothetical protein